MVDNIPLPSVEEVYEWIPDNVITFLESYRKELYLEDQDIKTIRDNRVTGATFLKLTLGKLLSYPYKFPGRPAELIADLINKIKDKEPEQKTVKTLEDIIEIILKDVMPNSLKQSDGLKMPLKDRDFAEAMTAIASNVSNNLKSLTAKTDFYILVSGGAPGIGKTRFGQELFDFIQTRGVIPTVNNRRPHFKYLHLDFGSSIKLDKFDYQLSTTVIIGLRIAYEFFIARKYEIEFQLFRERALPYIDTFKVESVFESIRKKPSIQNTHQLFSMNNDLAIFMLGPPKYTFVQTFLSGTAPQAVIATKEESNVSFKFVKCPMLSITSMIQIVDYYAEKFDTETFDKWRLCYRFLQLIKDTGGLPRALQLLLDVCFHDYNNCEEEFFLTIHKQFYNDIFNTIVEKLNTLYNIREFVKHNKRLTLELIHYCIEEIPVSTNECLDPNNNINTIENLETDSHIILKRYNDAFDQFLIKMPFFYICIYNDILHIIQEWEQSVANYGAFRTNLFIKRGMQTLRLQELYRGAYGKNSTLDIVVRLKKLSVCQASEQFLSKLTKETDTQIIDWKDGNVLFINCKSGQFGDSFVVREVVDGSKLLIIEQECWDYNSQEFTLYQVLEKSIKNIENVLRSKSPDGLLQYTPIIIFYTTQPYSGDPSELPDRCLLIAKGNFSTYFGPVFSSHAMFSLTRDINPNFSDPERMGSIIFDVNDQTAQDIVSKRPYHNEEEFYTKHPRIKRQHIKLSLYPFDLNIN
ncbi:14477_t:CDS:2 [Dentiscutata erythropus]|uniref:14477_t:CDS:1 n=1 Tax=Dentiscutata erythropus TaxID=1348616 RepID=A0A9N8WA71_9GLOM|nr:14477_t:CDS:2 [Dentiscutata erythropus]